MRGPSEAAGKTVQVGFEFGLHGLHEGDAGAYYAEVGFHGRPEGVVGGRVGPVALFESVKEEDAEGGDDAGSRKGGDPSVAFRDESMERGV